MSCKRRLILFSFLFVSFLALGQTVRGYSASSFNLQDGDWYDNFGIDRNYYDGPQGYLPNLATETLNENKELAYSIGESFLANYPTENERAEAILKYVQQWTEYGYDSDNVVRDGVAQEEWAWNADEMAHAFNPITGVTAVGDCEDLAFLCGTIYVGAGFDTAIVDAPDHVALLIWLPEFSNANNYWDLPNDNRDSGWIWVEATGSSNPLGWTPPDYQNGGWTAYSTGSLEVIAQPIPTQDASPTIDIGLLLIIGAILLIVILALSSARKR
jgi:hypothetical protein